MAATTLPSSRWVSTYTDKTAEWVQARLEYLENKEWQSRSGSIPRRKEIRGLRVELSERKKAALAAAAAALVPVTDPVVEPAPALPGPGPSGIMAAFKRIVAGK